MYSIEWSKVLVRPPREVPNDQHSGVGQAAVAGRKVPRVSRTVWALGLTSMLTDISSEMIASVLPVYLVLHLGMSPLMFGLVDGLYQGAAVLVRVIAGVLADRWHRYKEIAAFGYGLSAACRILLLAAGSFWGAIAGVIALDRIGKGIRTAPRDALIARRSRVADLSTAFGVHRSMDAAGAMLGPVLAFALLALMPSQYDVLFVASFGIAILGLGAILLFVPATEPGDRELGGPVVSFRSSLGLLVEPRFRGQVLASVFLGLSTISDSFVFLSLQQRLDVPAMAFPLLYVGTSLSTALFSAPLGWMADRFGRLPVLMGGYAFLAVVYLLLLFPLSHGLTSLGLTMLLFGIYYAATDGVLTAMAASVLPKPHSGSGLAVLATASNLARLSGSVLFGLLWSRVGIVPATIAFLLALSASIVVAFRLLSPSRPHVA